MEMALRCAVIDNGTVTNVIIADQSFAYSIGAIVCGTIPVGIGDTYTDGYFYREGERLVPDKTEIDMLKEENIKLKIQIEATASAVDFILMNLTPIV